MRISYSRCVMVSLRCHGVDRSTSTLYAENLFVGRPCAFFLDVSREWADTWRPAARWAGHGQPDRSVTPHPCVSSAGPPVSLVGVRDSASAAASALSMRSCSVATVAVRSQNGTSARDRCSV